MSPITGNSLENHMALTAGTNAQRHIKPCDFALLYKDRAAYANDGLGWGIRRSPGFDWAEHEGADRVANDPVFSPALGFLAALTSHGQIIYPGA